MLDIRQIIDATAGQPSSVATDTVITGVSTDSRTVRPGELFIALKGDNFDGEDFADSALKKGAVAAVVSRDFEGGPSQALIKVDDTRKALGAIARSHRERFCAPVIAITGSNGKTTTKDMLAHLLSQEFNVLKTKATENNDIGVPMTLLRLKDQDMAVIEIGSNSPGEIKAHADIIKPTIAVITNIGPSHLEGLKDLDNILREKIALVESLCQGDIWIKNADDAMLRQKRYSNVWTISYGIEAQDVDIRAEDIVQTRDGIEFNIKVSEKMHSKVPEGFAARFFMPVLGVHNVYNALAAISIGLLLMRVEAIRQALVSFVGPDMRLKLIRSNGFTVINDCYNSNPLSFSWALRSLKEYPAAGRRIVIAADMLELGEESSRLHYSSGRMVAENGIDMLIAYGERSRDIAKGAIDAGMDKENVSTFESKKDIDDFLRKSIAKEDIILVKGSRGMKMEEIVDCFTTYFTR